MCGYQPVRMIKSFSLLDSTVWRASRHGVEGCASREAKRYFKTPQGLCLLRTQDSRREVTRTRTFKNNEAKQKPFTSDTLKHTDTKPWAPAFKKEHLRHGGGGVGGGWRRFMEGG